jgi:protein-tyrosine phosphatase
MIDLHCHILPGLDDGPAEFEESLRMAKLAANDGITTIVATPHLLEIRPRLVESYINQAAAAADQLNRLLKKEQLPLTVKLGFEAALSPELPELAAQFSAVTIEGLRKYMLVELPSSQFPLYAEETFFRLQAQGICPIVAHPERNSALQREPEILESLVERGLLAQATASSFLGVSGRKAQRALENWCRKGYIQIVGSDAHSSDHRPPVLSSARKVLTQLVGKERADWIGEVPARVLAGKEVKTSFG